MCTAHFRAIARIARQIFQNCFRCGSPIPGLPARTVPLSVGNIGHRFTATSVFPVSREFPKLSPFASLGGSLLPTSNLRTLVNVPATRKMCSSCGFRNSDWSAALRRYRIQTILCRPEPPLFIASSPNFAKVNA